MAETETDGLKAISEKLEVINLQLAQRKTTRRKLLHWVLIGWCVLIAVLFVLLFFLKSPYLGWDYTDPETAVLGVAFHSLEWLFVRVAPLALLGGDRGHFLDPGQGITKPGPRSLRGALRSETKKDRQDRP